MVPVIIKTTSMGFRVSVAKNGIIVGTPHSIIPYTKRFIHQQYDRSEGCYRFINEYFQFYPEKEVCCFPKYDLDGFCAFLTERKVPYQIDLLPSVAGDPTEFHLLPFVTFKNDKQKNAVAYLTNDQSGPVRGLGIQTGFGKTVSLIMAIQKLGVRGMVTMTSRLEQWVSEIIKYTTLDEDDILIVQGVGGITKLFDSVENGSLPKFILMSTKTLQLYMNYGDAYKHLPHPLEMCEALGIGVVASDEAHEWYHTNFIMSVVLNPQIFIPITATFVANDPFVKTIFESMMPKSVQFEGGEYDRYVNITAYNFLSAYGMVKPYNYSRRMGYSQVKFEEFLLSKKGSKLLEMLVRDAIIPMIRQHYIDICDDEDGERMLFLCATKDFGDHMANIFKRHFNSKTVSTFYSGMPLTILERFDIIVSTPGSAGTGRDIKKLRTCFVFDNTGSEIRNLQYLGRLRPYPATKHTPEFIYLSLDCIEPHRKYNRSRSMLYGPRAKQFRHRSIQ